MGVYSWPNGMRLKDKRWEEDFAAVTSKFYLICKKMGGGEQKILTCILLMPLVLSVRLHTCSNKCKR
jgi:hypothetical protein